MRSLEAGRVLEVVRIADGAGGFIVEEFARLSTEDLDEAAWIGLPRPFRPGATTSQADADAMAVRLQRRGFRIGVHYRRTAAGSRGRRVYCVHSKDWSRLETVSRLAMAVGVGKALDLLAAGRGGAA